MSVEADPDTLQKEYCPSFRCHNFKAAFDYILRYPLLMAVARCSMVVPRHRPCVITLVYQPEGDITETVFLVGKGVTYDTGTTDVTL